MADVSPITFGPSAAAAIIAATKHYQNSVKGGGGTGTTGSAGGRDGIWAKITDVDVSDKSYSWTAQKPKDDGTFEDDTDLEGEMAGDKYATEANDRTDVPIGEIVKMYNHFEHFIFWWGGGSSAKLCKAVSSISSNATGDVNEWELGPSEVDPTNEFEAYNPTDNTIPTDVLCLAVQVKGGYILIPLQCPG